MKPIDQMFRAFADETRLRILNLLAHERELCVCDIQSILKLPQAKISRHLAYLRGSGLVAVRKAGLWKHYSLTRPEGGFHKGLLSCLSGCFGEVGALRRDIQTLKRRAPRLKGCA